MSKMRAFTVNITLHLATDGEPDAIERALESLITAESIVGTMLEDERIVLLDTQIDVQDPRR